MVTASRVAKGPERNDDEAQAEGTHHAAAASRDLRKMPENNGANDRAHIVKDGDVGSLRRERVVDFLKEIGEEILRAVGEKHHEGHEHDQVDENFPAAGDYPENGSGGWRAVLGPGLGLGNFCADV